MTTHVVVAKGWTCWTCSATDRARTPDEAASVKAAGQRHQRDTGHFVRPWTLYQAERPPPGMRSPLQELDP